jgi:hypothetical protein
LTSIPIDLDWERMILLLNRFEKRKLSKEEAKELEPLVIKYYEKALVKGDRKLMKKLSVILLGLNGYISGDISESEYRRFSNV